MPYDSGLATRVDDALRSLGERAIRQKNVFGGRGFLAGKSTFVIVHGDGVLVKTAPDEYDAAVAESGVTPFTPDGAHPMGTWVVVPGDRVADDPELAEWVERGLRGIGRR
jgi:TfoX/Sxy family transcriptional regulator of competence genes